MIDISYFEKRIKKDNNGCWIWQLATDKLGYGKCSMNLEGKKRSYKVHRLAYSAFYGEIKDKSLCVCHSCDNTQCCNPSHLFLGTHQDNMDDMVNKGRQKTGKQYGNNNRGIKIVAGGIQFNSYSEAGRYFNISDNGIKKRIKTKIKGYYLI